MSEIVLVHGAFNELWGPHELKARWLPALQDGVWHHGGSIDPDAVAVCFYGDLFRLDLSDHDPEAWQRSKAGAEDLLSGLGGSDTLDFLSEAAGQAAYDRTVAMVATMTSDPALAQRMRQRLVELIAPHTRVVVGHSLGSVVAYRALLAHPELEVDTLVTLGSPLGSTWFDDGDSLGEWPGSVRRWVNIYDRGDRAAGPRGFDGRFGDSVEEYRVDNGHRSHDPEPYLNSRPTGAAVLRALRQPAG